MRRRCLTMCPSMGPAPSESDSACNVSLVDGAESLCGVPLEPRGDRPGRGPPVLIPIRVDRARRSENLSSVCHSKVRATQAILLAGYQVQIYIIILLSPG